MAILPVGISGEAGAYQIERSLRFNSADSAYLSRTPASTSSSTKATFSFWVKPSKTINGTTNPGTIVGRMSGNYNFVQFWDQNNNGNPVLYMGNTSVWMNTASVFRDYSAWYHVVCILDTTQATDSNRLQIWVNGVRQAAGGFTTWPSLNSNQEFINSSSATYYLGQNGNGGGYLNAYLADVYFIDGQALTPSSFGETDTDTGVWKPKAYSGSYGTNGFYLDFADNSSTTALGYDAAGSNDWTPNNFSVTAGAGNDSLVDSPTRYGTDTGVGGEVRGNYATWNPIRPSGATITNGNLDAVTGNAGSSNTGYLTSTIWLPTSGKWYFEITPTSVGEVSIGLTTESNNRAAIYYRQGDVYINGSVSFTGSSYTSNDVIGVAVDMDALTIRFYKNNTAQGSGTSSLSGMTGPFVPCVAHLSGSGSSTVVANFGQRPFAYTAPSGFKALCTTNLPEPTIADGKDYFNPVLYTGNGSARTIDLGLDSDFTWIKARNGAGDHALFDNVRASGSSYPVLISNKTDAESTSPWVDDVSTVLSLTGGGYNGSGTTYVAWNWKANGAGVSNTAGTISSTVSANTTAGFSIITYTGTGSAMTFGHGLGATPEFFIIKYRNAADDWFVYHKSIGLSKSVLLNSTAAAGTDSGFQSVSSTTIGIGVSGGRNTNGGNYVCYAFAPIAGYSAFGSFVGSGSADGPMIFCNFRPRYVLIKRSTGVDNWFVYDTARSTYNLASQTLQPNTSNAEDTTVNQIDILSNGFKCRSTNTATNQSGETYVYACFAENPMKFSLAR